MTADLPETVKDLIYGRWRSQVMYAGVKLGMFDALDGEPKTAAVVAQELGLDPAMTYRLLRALGSLGLLKEQHDQCFSLSEAGELLRSDHPQTLRSLVLLVNGPEGNAVWQHLPAIVRDGKQDGFVREFGLTVFDYAARNPDYEEVFDGAMSSHSTVQTAWALEALRAYDFSSILHLCDIGGGQGYLLCHFLLKYPHLFGTVLDRARVFENRQALWAEKLNVSDRCRYVAGDMFVDVPPADAYLLKMILHDWNDEECVQILQNTYKRAPSAGRIFIIEYVIPEADRPHFAKLFDINMMCLATGRERTSEEYATLLKRAGWNYVATWLPQKGDIGVVEGEK